MTVACVGGRGLKGQTSKMTVTMKAGMSQEQAIAKVGPKVAAERRESRGLTGLVPFNEDTNGTEQGVR